MRNSEYRANQELANTPRRRINRDYAPTVIPLGEVLTLLGALTVACAVIAFSEELSKWLKILWSAATAAG
jgi:hypothetical protein